MGCESCERAKALQAQVTPQVVTCDTKLSISAPTTVVDGIPFIIEAKLDGIGLLCEGPVSDVTVELYIDGMRVSTAGTDSNGNAIFYESVRHGQHALQVVFPGEFGLLRYYNGSSSEIRYIFARAAGSPQCIADAECGAGYKCIDNVCVPAPPAKKEIPWLWIGAGVAVLGIGALILTKPKEK